MTRGAGGLKEIAEEETDPVAVEIVFDASGSMAARVGSKRKIDIARKALASALTKLDATDSVVGLRAYGFDSSVDKTPEASCPNTALIGPFNQRSSSQLLAAAARLNPYGYAPIAASIEQAGQDLRDVAARDRMIILVSDGEETCGGDPVGVAGQLHQDRVAVATYVVGFDLDAAQRRQMRAIARAGGGAYFDATDAQSLEAAIGQAVGVTLRKSKRIVEKCINPLHGGDTIDQAMPVSPGLYTVGEMLPKTTERFYRVDTKPGQSVKIRGLIQSHETYPGKDGRPFETKHALGAFTLQAYGADGRPLPIRAARQSSLPGTAFDLDVTDKTGEGIIFSVGDAYGWTAPDALFAVEIDGETGATPAPASSTPKTFTPKTFAPPAPGSR